MVKVSEYREWAKKNSISHGSGAGVDAESIAEAEAYVSEFPLNYNGFASCASHEVEWSGETDTKQRLRDMLRVAGYVPADDGANYVKPGFVAQALYHTGRGDACIHVYCAAAGVAMGASAGGAMPIGDMPRV